MRLMKNALAGALSLLLACAPLAAAAADNMTVLDSAAATKTLRCVDVGSLILACTNTIADHLGNLIDPATSTKQPALGTAGTPSTDVISTQFSDFRPNSANITASDIASTSTAAMNAVNVVTGTPTAGSAVSQAINGSSSATITVTAASGFTGVIEGAGDGGTNWVALSGLQRGYAVTLSTVTGNGVFSVDVSGMTNLRVRGTAGTATVKMAFSDASGLTKILNPVRVVDGSGAAGPDATEKQLGHVTGQMTFVSATAATTAATRASGDVVGGLLTFSSAGRVSGGTGLVQSALVDWKSNQTTANAAMDLFLFSDTSLSSTCTNASAFVLSASDWAKVVGVIHLTDTTAGNTTTHVQATGLALPYSTAATTLYGCAVTRGAPVVGSTSDITLKLGLVQN